jgi:uncharacterized membrane protein
MRHIHKIATIAIFGYAAVMTSLGAVAVWLAWSNPQVHSQPHDWSGIAIIGGISIFVGLAVLLRIRLAVLALCLLSASLGILIAHQTFLDMNPDIAQRVAAIFSLAFGTFPILLLCFAWNSFFTCRDVYRRFFLHTSTNPNSA